MMEELPITDSYRQPMLVKSELWVYLEDYYQQQEEK